MSDIAGQRIESKRAVLNDSMVISGLEKGVSSGRFDDFSCVLGEEIKFQYSALEQYCWRPLSDLEIDLLTVAALVVFSDRSVLRPSQTWARSLVLRVPVYDLDTWASDEVEFLLCDCLRFLTGDQWRFEFYPRQRRDEILVASWRLREPFDKEVVVMPYSGGLDSFAELKRFNAVQKGDVTLIPVSALHRFSLDSVLADTTIPGGENYSLLRVPLRISTPRHPESSFRSRTFLFFVLAAVVARLTDATRVIIPENGQGALGPSLIPWGNEHPFQSSHPAFTLRLGKLLDSLWGRRSVAFSHPNVWSTKSAVLRSAASVAGTDGWGKTLSCGFDPRRAKSAASGPVQCGACGGCLLRRMSLIAGGFVELEKSEEYFWSDLRSESLEGAVTHSLPEKARPTKDGDVRMATSSVINSQSLAQISDSLGGTVVKRAIFEIGSGLGIEQEEVVGRLSRLLAAHKADWDLYLEYLGSNSWISKVAEVGDGSHRQN